MTIDQLIEKARRVKGVEQIEFCPVGDSFAFIFRANGDRRYGTVLPARRANAKIYITDVLGKDFIRKVRKIVHG